MKDSEVIWNSIKDYEGLYEITIKGQVKALSRKVYRANEKR